MSYKPPRPEEKAGHSSVGRHEAGALVTAFKVLLGVTISITLLVLFVASAGLAWMVLFTGPAFEVRAVPDGSVEIVVPEDRAGSIARVRVAGTDGRVVWEVAARDRTMTIPPLRLSAGTNPVNPGLGGPVTIVHPASGTTFALDDAASYAITVWGPNEAGGRGSTTRWFTLPAAHRGAARP